MPKKESKKNRNKEKNPDLNIRIPRTRSKSRKSNNPQPDVSVTEISESGKEAITDGNVSSQKPKPRKRRKKNSPVEYVPSTEDILLADLNKKKDGGKDAFEADVRELTVKADVALRSYESSSKSGGCFLSSYRLQRMIDYLEDRKAWKSCEEFDPEKKELKKKMDAHKAPGTWQYKYRVVEIEGKKILQRQSANFNATVISSKTAVRKRMEMKETDWVKAQAVDDETFFETMNEIHWNTDPRKHLKGQHFYKSCVDVMSSNVNNALCNLLTKHCPVCQVASQRYLPNNPPSHSVPKQTKQKQVRSYVFVNIIRIDSLLIVKENQVVTHVITVIYHNGFTEFIPSSSPSQRSVCGHLYHSFSRNCIPLEIFLVFRNGSSTDRLGHGTHITESLLEYEASLISSINTLLPGRRNIPVKTGARVNCSEMEFSVTFLLECLVIHSNKFSHDQIHLTLSLMQEHLNQEQKYSGHIRRSTVGDAKEEVSVLFGPSGTSGKEVVLNAEVVNEETQNMLFQDERIAFPNPPPSSVAKTSLHPQQPLGESSIECLNLVNKNMSTSVDQHLHIPNSGRIALSNPTPPSVAQTPLQSQEPLGETPIEYATPLQHNLGESVNRKLHIPNSEDGNSKEVQEGFKVSGQLMANNMMNDILNNSTFDTDDTKYISIIKTTMPKTTFGLKSIPSNLVTSVIKGYQCYAVAALQLMQVFQPLWYDLVESFAEEGVMFEDVCESRPVSFALLMYGSKLKDEYVKKLKDLKEPSPIQHTTWRTWQTHAKILSTNKQEDSSEFLTILFNALDVECENHQRMHLSLRSYLFFQSTPQYQCLCCENMRETVTQSSNMIQLPLTSTGEHMSIQSLLSKFLNFNLMANRNETDQPCLPDDASILPCTNCKGKETKHSSWEEMTDLPNYLVMCLKRYHKNGKKIEKQVSCDTSVTIPEVERTGEFVLEGVKGSHIYFFTHSQQWMCNVYLDGQKLMCKEHQYFLLGVICHLGTLMKEGHYTCYILEQIDNHMWYHHMDGETHSLVSHNNFELDVNKNGYIFLYGKKAPSSFQGNPYDGHRTEFSSLENKYLHVFRKRGKARGAKSARMSDIGVVEKTDLSQLLSQTREDFFDTEAIDSSNESNSIQEIPNHKEDEINELLAKNINLLRDVSSSQPKLPVTALTVKVPTPQNQDDLIMNPTNLAKDVSEPNLLGKDLTPQKKDDLIMDPTNPTAESVVPYNQGNSGTDAITISDHGPELPFAASSDYRSTLIRNFKLTYTDHTLRSLASGNWLNDCVINYFFSCLFIADPKEDVCVLDSQFVQSINDDRSKMTRFLQGRLDRRDLSKLSSLDFLVPLNVDSSHWVLARLKSFGAHVTIYDSIEDSVFSREHHNFMSDIMDVVDDMMKECNNSSWESIGDLTVEIKKNVPKQTNGYDCGLYTCMFAKQVYFNEATSFTPKFIGDLRIFLHEHIRDSKHHFITFEEAIWKDVNNKEVVVEYGQYYDYTFTHVNI